MNKIEKKLCFCLILIFGVFAKSPAQGLRLEKISESLLQRMQEAPDKHHTIGILLADQVDLKAMEAYLAAKKATLEERAYTVITSLQQKALQTQPALLGRIEKMRGIELPSVEPFWITNAIYLNANAEGIAALSQDPAVAMLDLYQVPELHDGEAADSDFRSRPPSSVWDSLRSLPNSDFPLPTSNVQENRTERGLVAIGADQMWRMGYTGYGTRALIVDSGQDGSHPALHNQFLFNQRPINLAWPNSQGPYYCGDHGTHVAGTILGLDRLMEDTIGVAFNAQWMGGPIELSNCGEYVGGSPVNAITVFQWAINPDGDPSTIDDMPHVINNSWGRSSPNSGDCQAPFLGNTIEALYTAGVAVVWSAGNDGPGAQTIGNPAMTNNSLVRILSVGNVNGNSSSFPISFDSSRGPSVCGGTGSLLIKPEVCAPGGNVRSSVVGGGYQQFSGTSMAAPHVSGAVLLLKEAFPDLTGEEILLALYFSAIDLGPPGEDNSYGMGIINVPAAYQYLIDQGNEPALPVEAPNDVILLQIDARELNCEKQATTRLLVENNGTEEVTSMNIRHAFLSGNEPVYFTHQWEGTIAPGERQYIQMPPLPSEEAGEFEYVAEITEANGTADARRLNNQLKVRISILEDELLEGQASGNLAVCQGGQALLQSLYDGPAVVRWYDELQGGNLLAEGRNALLPVGDQPLTVYMEVAPLEKVGRLNNQEGIQQSSNNMEGLVFDVFSPFAIKSVKVYAGEAGSRLIGLRNPNGTSLTKLVSIPEGEQRIELNFNVTPGEGWELFLKGGKPLGLSLGGELFPYVIPNILTIRKSTQSVVFYHYFYDWEVEYPYFCGRAPVEVDVLPTSNAPQAAFNPADTVIDLSSGFNEVAFTDESEGSTSWLWDFGDGTTSTAPNPLHAYADTGQYVVTLTVSGQDGCASSAAGVVTAMETTMTSASQPAREYKMEVFPNPAHDLIYLTLGFAQPREAEVLLADMLGRQVWRQRLEFSPKEAVEISVSELPAGLYSVIVRLDGAQLERRVVVGR